MFSSISYKRFQFLMFLVMIPFGLCRGGIQDGPHFLYEPPSTLTFLNTTGATLNCAVRNSQIPTQVTWVVGETGLTASMSIPGVRELLLNGSLVFLPFTPSSYRQEIHSTSYRCLATSAAGSIVSRTVTVRAVVEQEYEVRVYDEYVISGNTAVLKCHIAPYVQDYVKVIAWIQDNSVIIKPGLDSGGKYMILHDGSLHIYRADPSDGYRSYKCMTNHTLTGETRKSSSGRVIITEPHGDAPPRLTVSKKIQLTVKAGQEAILPCAAQAYPTPSYSWKRVGDGVSQQIVGVSPRFSQVGGLLLISSVGVGDQGRYSCSVNNSLGHDYVEVALRVTEPLRVHVSPNRLVVDMGKTATFRCVVQGHPVTSLTWLRNGLPIPSDPRIVSSPRETLTISRVDKDDKGAYQCVTSARHHTAQASAYLALGDSTPEISYRFQKQTLQPGPSVSLKCVATGNPPPQFTWTLDGFSLPESERYLVGQYVTIHDDVISHVNITNVRVEDGGEYTCEATNSVGSVSHSAPVNVYGLPFIRPMQRISAVAGSDLKIKCPVAGYPIESITWEKDGRRLRNNMHQLVFPNGTFILKQTQRGLDEGRYSCTAANVHGHSDSKEVQVVVTVPPKIMPFSFANNVLSEGNRASITCQILEGDLPVTFRWQKDNGNIPMYKGVSTRLLDDYSSQLVIESISSKHNGDFTCLTTNSAATRKHTATLTVNVPPHWVTEPQDRSVAQGAQVSLHCQAEGFPKPSITWKRTKGINPNLPYEKILPAPNTILSNNGTITFRNVEKAMEGNYLCQAENGIKTGLGKNVLLTVNSPAHFPEKMSRVVSRVGERAELRCAALGDQPTDILWYVDSRILDPHADRRMIIQKETTNERLISTVVISTTARTHSGSYTCNAANAFGRDTRTIELVVQEEPEKPRNLRVSETKSRLISLRWSAPYSGNAPIQNYIIQYKLASENWKANPEQLSIPGDQTNAIIKDLNPASAFHLRVVAQNILGLSLPSEVIQATTEEEEPSGSPQDVRVAADSSTNLRVTWEPPSREQWNGNILGYYLGHRPYALSADYNFQTVEVGSHYGGQAVLSGLQQYTRYEVVIQAFNNRGAGPLSPPAIATTLEDVPNSPPETIRCEAPSPKSISVAWRPPPVSGQNGLIKGYKVLYRIAEKYPDDEPQTKSTGAESTNLFNLEKFTNYSISVLAFTAPGDGVASSPVYCRTKQDVPDSPSAIKAFSSSSSTILVTWLHPKKLNGELTKYTLYTAVINSASEEKNLTPRNLGPDETSYQYEEISLRHTYQFWVTGSTQPGEGPPTEKIKVKPTKTVGARIASFGISLDVPWKEDIRLLCHSVGEPAPKITWDRENIPITTGSRNQILPNGSLFIRDVQKTDGGNLTCNANNTHNSDSITYSVTVQVPPSPPSLFVPESSKNAITLKWTLRPHLEQVRGFIINYKRDYGDWEEVKLHSPSTFHSLSDLICGSRYSLYVTAFNEVGAGLPSEILTASTKGGEPKIPNISRLLEVNATSILVHLNTFGDGGCPINYYVIEYKIFGERDWISVSNNVAATEKNWVIRDLKPATKYTVKVIAHNQSGFKSAVYNIVTLNPIGVFHDGSTSQSEGTLHSPPIHQNLKILVPSLVILVLLVLILLGVIAYVLRKRKKLKGSLDHLADSPSAQIQSEQNQQSQQYTALTHNSPSTQDTSTYKAESDYIEDICPYATFQLPQAPKNQYVESTDSGIVYSGTYHPVQGAFLYHEPKMSTVESFALRHKEPEYMKVRRKGRRDPHHESTESDNLGSTDSEVKKILSLHMPISEYDTLGSDSEGQGPTDSPPTFAESAALSHALVHHKGGRTRPDPTGIAHNRGSSDIFKHRIRIRQSEGSKSQEGSSSSTDTSTSDRRAHHRRGKKISKRSSRGGSHTSYEETSFSYEKEVKLSKAERKLNRMSKMASRMAKSPDVSEVVGRRKSSSTPVGAKIRAVPDDQAPPVPPPRGYLESCNRAMSEEEGKPRRTSISSKVPQQQQFYKGGARPRDSSYQINV